MSDVCGNLDNCTKRVYRVAKDYPKGERMKILEHFSGFTKGCTVEKRAGCKYEKDLVKI